MFVNSWLKFNWLTVNIFNIIFLRGNKSLLNFITVKLNKQEKNKQLINFYGKCKRNHS